MGVRNTLGDLHNILMEQMERLNDSEDSEQLKAEVERSRAMSGVASQIIGNARTIAGIIDKAAVSGVKPPRILTDGADNGDKVDS